MAKETGGPAFPEHLAVTPMGDTYSGEAGMTLRDYFAAKAMKSLILDGFFQSQLREVGISEISQEISTCAYEMADAMLAERSK